MKELVNTLKQHNLKVTPQRLSIFSLLDSSKSHPSAETIYNELIVDNPSLSLATVYKNLDTLKSYGLIQELNVGETSCRYDATTHPHPHSICLTCGAVKDMPKIELQDSIKLELSRQTGFEIKFERLYYYGICEHCSID